MAIIPLRLWREAFMRRPKLETSIQAIVNNQQLLSLNATSCGSSDAEAQLREVTRQRAARLCHYAEIISSNVLKD
jgi:hypothetical protein